MQSALLVQSFLSFGPRFIYRHPAKLNQLCEHWRGYQRRLKALSSLSGQDEDRVEALLNEVKDEAPCFREMNGFWRMPLYAIVEYLLVRLMQPKVVVETGVEYGLSSRVMLLAMERNGRGTLHSIDFPNQDIVIESSGFRQRNIMPPGRETGWLVPSDLRGRWHLHLGDAKELLPKLLATLEPIDIFVHDSLHSYDHMLFEFRTAWPHLRGGGVICSDDIDANLAFADFAAEVNCPGEIFNNQRVGVIRKPGPSAMIEKSESSRGAIPNTQM
ncbi:MAG: class I SAM-dependent methyltransferase [Nitrospiraceae bacterium]